MAGRKCTVCTHERRAEIEEQILSGKSFRHISSQFVGVGYRSVQRHKVDGHIAKELAEAIKLKNIAFSDDVLHKLKFLQNEALQILREAKEAKTLGYALSAIGKAAQLVETQAKLAGQIEEINVNIYLNPQWVELKQQIFAVLAKHPAALKALTKAMAQGETNGSQG